MAEFCFVIFSLKELVVLHVSVYFLKHITFCKKKQKTKRKMKKLLHIFYRWGLYTKFLLATNNSS